MTQQKPKQWLGNKSDFVRAHPSVQPAQLEKLAKQYGIAIKASSVSAIRAMDRKNDSSGPQKKQAPAPGADKATKNLVLSIPSVDISTNGLATFIREQVRREVQAAFAKLST